MGYKFTEPDRTDEDTGTKGEADRPGNTLFNHELAFRAQVEAVDNKMLSARQYQLLEGLERALAGLCRQVFEQALPMRLDKVCVNDYRQQLGTFRSQLAEQLPDAEWQVCKDAAKDIVKEGFPEEMALEMASFRYLAGFLPAVHIVEKTGTDLLQAIRAAHRGEQFVDPALAGHVISSYVGRQSTNKGGRVNLLTPREQEVCSLLAYGHTNGEIAGKLFISERTVETHREHLMGKLNLKSRAELVRFSIDNDLLKLG